MSHATREVARWIAEFDTSALRTQTRARACHAVLDWAGVAIAGAREPLVDILVADAWEFGEGGNASLVGRGETVSPTTAALINGAASHALDFDDVNAQMHGHPSAAVLPGLLALAEQRHASGRQLLDAFIVGYQVACAVGEMMEPSHYEKGWHATATMGTFGAAAGAARLLGLSAEQCAHALGIAATQAAGLKAMFGTMCKPLHAGKASMNGLLAARWAARGFTSNPDAIETHQGFAHTQSTSFAFAPLPADASASFAVEAGLYKYHAACYLTHAAIEAGNALRREHEFDPDNIKAVRVQVLPTLRDVCDIEAPASGLEVKFSIRHLAAMALRGVDTSSLDAYSDAVAARPDIIALRSRVELVPGVDLPNRSSTRLEVEMVDGARFEHFSNVGLPLADTSEEWRKLADKFQQIVTPVFGHDLALALINDISAVDDATDTAQLAGALRGN